MAFFGFGSVVFVHATTVPLVYVFAFCLGIGFGGGVVCLMTVLGNYFGLKAFALLCGIAIAVNTTLSAIAPWAAGRLFEHGYGYQGICYFLGGLVFRGRAGAVPHSTSNPTPTGDCSCMTQIQEGALLWKPSAARLERSHLTRYLSGWPTRGHKFDDYESLWRWSVSDLPAFWQSMVDFCGMQFTTPPSQVLGKREMPGAEWFPGGRLNYAAHALRHERPGEDAHHPSVRTPAAGVDVLDGIRAAGEGARHLDARHRHRARRSRGGLSTQHSRKPWSRCMPRRASARCGRVAAPISGPAACSTGIRNSRPKLIFCVDGYSYGGKLFDKRGEIRADHRRAADDLARGAPAVPRSGGSRAAHAALGLLGGRAVRRGSRP